MRGCFATYILLTISFVVNVQAQHPVEIQRKTASGDYMAALATYKRMPTRKATAASAVAAGKSAWALGLNDVAKSEFDRALSLGDLNGELDESEVGRIYFSRGIIEFQEENYQSSFSD